MRAAVRRRARRAFTIIEAAISGVILMVGVIALIQIGRAAANQIDDIRRTQGQPAIAERLVHDQYEAIMALTGPATDSPPLVPPVGLDGAAYSVSGERYPSGDRSVGGEKLWCYRIQVKFQDKNFRVAEAESPAVFLWRQQ